MMGDILTPPNNMLCNPLTISMVLAPLTTVSPVSSFNNRSQTDGPLSEFWRAFITVPARRPGTLDEPGWRDNAAFITSLRGGFNTCRLYDARRHPMRGAGGVLSTISLDAPAAAGATTIQVKGLIPSQLVAMAVDDHFGVGENLYKVVRSHTQSNALGRGTVSFLPPFRAAAAEGDSINLSKPTANMQLIGGYQDMSIPHFGRSAPMVLEFFEQPVFED